MALVHLDQGSSKLATLDDYRVAIVKEIDGVALRVGKLLRDAKAADPDNFYAWVESDLPFGAETARRLMAISAAYEKLPGERLAQLPRPWQAMYALKALPVETIEAGIDRGEIRPDMTVREAQQFSRRWKNRKPPLRAKEKDRRADLAAAKLMHFAPWELSDGVRAILRSWLERGTTPGVGDRGPFRSEMLMDEDQRRSG